MASIDMRVGKGKNVFFDVLSLNTNSFPSHPFSRSLATKALAFSCVLQWPEPVAQTNRVFVFACFIQAFGTPPSTSMFRYKIPLILPNSRLRLRLIIFRTREVVRSSLYTVAFDGRSIKTISSPPGSSPGTVMSRQR